jgi:hypothetical protein
MFAHREHPELQVKHYYPIFSELKARNRWIILQRFVFFFRRILIAIAVVCVETFIWQLFLMFF